MTPDRTTRRKRDVYIAIMVAAATGKGVRLSWDECADLAMDDAVATRAANGLSPGEFKHTGDGAFMHDGWKLIDPYAARHSGNFAMMSESEQRAALNTTGGSNDR